jgi:hypothetical protein
VSPACTGVASPALEKTRLFAGTEGCSCGESRNATRRGKGRDARLPRIHAHLREDAKARFTVRRQTMRRPLRAKLSVKTELRRRMTRPIPEQSAYLRSVLTGHARYYGVCGNGAALRIFRHQLSWLGDAFCAAVAIAAYRAWEPFALLQRSTAQQTRPPRPRPL